MEKVRLKSKGFELAELVDFANKYVEIVNKKTNDICLDWRDEMNIFSQISEYNSNFEEHSYEYLDDTITLITTKRKIELISSKYDFKIYMRRKFLYKQPLLRNLITVHSIGIITFGILSYITKMSSMVISYTLTALITTIISLLLDKRKIKL